MNITFLPNYSTSNTFIFNGAIKPFVPKMTKQLSKKMADELMKQL